MDVKNKSLFPEIQPTVYDGNSLPISDSKFNTVLLLTVLHHTNKPEIVLKEAVRVSKERLIVMEDIYSNPMNLSLRNCKGSFPMTVMFTSS